MFLVDISGSVNGEILENVKKALMASLNKLDPQDSFNIIGFNGGIHIFSSSMEPASKAGISKATMWIGEKLIADGGTNILLPLKQVCMASHVSLKTSIQSLWEKLMIFRFMLRQ